MANSVAVGATVVIRTVYGSTCSTPATLARLYCRPDVGWRYTSKEYTTSAAVKSSPLWNFTPRRSLNSQVWSSSSDQDSARSPIGLKLGAS